MCIMIIFYSLFSILYVYITLTQFIFCSEIDEDKKILSTKSTCNQLSSDTDNQDDSQDSSDSIKPNAIYEIVQAVRKETQLSHDMSKVAVETVLISLRVS